MPGCVRATVSVNRPHPTPATPGASLLFLILSVLWLLAPLPTPAADTHPVAFKHLTMAEGLSQDTVLAVFQDPTGYIWLGTGSGLNRFDGKRVRSYRRQRGNDSALQSDHIRAIDADAEGNLWLATDDAGIARFDRATQTFKHYFGGPQPGALSEAGARTLLVLADGTVLVGTGHSGIDRFDPAKEIVTANYRNLDGDQRRQGDDTIRALAATAPEAVYVGTDGGLFHLDLPSGNVTPVAPAGDTQRITRGPIRSLLHDSAGRLWVGTADQGIAVIDASGRLVSSLRHEPGKAQSLSSNYVAAMQQGQRGRIWVGTPHGLDAYLPATGHFAHYRPDPQDPTSLGRSQVTSLLADRHGLLWVGTGNNGVSRFDPRSLAFGHFRPGAAAPASWTVTALLETTAGEVLMGTGGGGLHRLHRTERTGQVIDSTRLALPHGNDYITALANAGDGSVWVGMRNGELERLELLGDEVRTLPRGTTHPPPSFGHPITSLQEDTAGVLWAGTWGAGVHRLPPDADPSSIDSTSGLSDDRVTAIAADADGQVWIGTSGGGVNLLDADGRVVTAMRSNSRQPDALASDIVHALHIDARGRLWVGGESGLDRLLRRGSDPRNWRWRNHSTRDGLSGNAVRAILHDKADRLWLSTNHGLTSFEPSSGQTRAYYREDGLQGWQFIRGAHLATADGAIYFGGNNGLNGFYPARLPRSRQPPPVAITDISKRGQPMHAPPQATDGLTLTHEDKAITFHFAALDYAAPEHSEYSYRLDGLDRDWSAPGTAPNATYTNLDPGNYVFRVRARHRDGRWSDHDISVPLTVVPGPWRTWWALLLYTAGGVALLLALPTVQQLRLRQAASQRRRLQHDLDERSRAIEQQAGAMRILDERLRHAMLTDPLTGLPNRRGLFEDIAEQISARCRHKAAGKDATGEVLLFSLLDLDNFKRLNDQHGHRVGDALLVHVTEVLREACAAEDWIIRFGDDELLVVQPVQSQEDPVALVERLRACVANTLVPGAEDDFVRTTASAGFARYPFVRGAPEAVSWEQVIILAGHALDVSRTQQNTYTGYSATAQTADCQDLVAQLRGNPTAMIEAGLICVTQAPRIASTTARAS